jgi:hypothetical protein
VEKDMDKALSPVRRVHPKYGPVFDKQCALRWGINARMRFDAATSGGRGLLPRRDAPLLGLIGSGYNEGVY